MTQGEQTTMGIDQATALTRRRYDRVAPWYDAFEWSVERTTFGRLRKRLWSGVHGESVLEVGVGTGKNIPYYPPSSRVTAIDLSERMLEHARRRAAGLGLSPEFHAMDIQQALFADASFDAAVATFVFCSVPDPIRGLRQLARVTKPDGDIWLLEHVRLDGPLAGRLMDLLNPLMVRLMGANINRRTVDNVAASGLEVLEVQSFHGGLVRMIHARPRTPAAGPGFDRAPRRSAAASTFGKRWTSDG